MAARREFFPRVRKTVVPRPVVKPAPPEVPGQTGSVRAAAATIYGENWYHDQAQDLIEIWDAGAALCFKDVLPRKDLYASEGLYLRLVLAYRTTPNAFVNVRTLAGNHVTLPNAEHGAMFEDPATRYYVTEDCTININSIHREERLWLQRVDWEWVSQETIFEDELATQDPFVERTPEQVAALYAQKRITAETVRDFLIQKIQEDSVFAKRCLLLLCDDALVRKDFVALFEMLNHAPE
jgi:hypothetical protein